MDDPKLPQDLAACHSLIRQLAARVEDQEFLAFEHAQTIGEMQQSRETLSQENEELKLTVNRLLERLYGRRSERMIDDPNQLKLLFGDDPAAQDAFVDAAVEAERIVEEYLVRRTVGDKKKPRNDKLPAHLPRRIVMNDVPDDEKNCSKHGPRKVIGYDDQETLIIGRPELEILVTRTPKYGCEDESDCGVLQAPRRVGLIEGNRYDTSIAVEIITAKYGYHLPFYRQQDLFAGSGWTPSRSTLLNIMVAGELVLRPLAYYYRQVLLSGCGLGCDETRVTLIVPPVAPPVDPNDPRSRRIHDVLSQAQAKGSKSIDGRMWAYRGFDIPINVFDFTVSRHRDGPDEFLAEYSGKLMGDCWSGFQKIELRSDDRIVRGACWAHARRKVLEGLSSHPRQATVLLAMMRQLYDIEERGKTFGPEDRRAMRERQSRPLLDRIRTYIDSEECSRVLPKSVFAEALSYLRNHWGALHVFLSDGRMPIDNNDVEQLMKQIALGRKNWLFLGSVEAGVRAATLLTLVSTAVRNDLDVWAYLKDVLDQLLAGCTDYHSLRADVWKQSHPEAVRFYRSDERRDAADRQRLRRARRRIATQAQS